MQRLLMIGMNHATAPLPVREKCAFSAQQREEAIAQFRAEYPSSEIVLVSTCNRVELYAARPIHGHPRIEQLSEFLAKFHGCDVAELRTHIYERSGKAVAEHLFSVASSLDSLVVGETQILGQIREAYEVANKLSSAGNLLHPLFQKAIAAGKEVLTVTRLGEGRRSIASIAVEYASQIFENFSDKTILSIGAGKMSTLVLKHFSEMHIKRLLVSNRDPLKAQALAEKFGGSPVPFETLTDHLAEADIVVTSTASPLPIITRAMFEQVMKHRRWRPVFVVDIALPRDVEEGVGEINNCYLYNIDDLQQVASATDSNRQDALANARTLVGQRVEEFMHWTQTRELGPLIEQLFAKSHAMAREEVLRTVNKIPDMTDEEKQHMEDLARRIVNKILNDPIQAVRSGVNKDGSPSIHALSRLFRLQEEEKSDKSEGA